MPLETIDAYQDHGNPSPEPFTAADIEQARADLDRLADVGVDYDDVVKVLENEVSTSSPRAGSSYSRTSRRHNCQLPAAKIFETSLTNPLFLSLIERMFVGMGYATWSTDEVEQELVIDEAETLAYRCQEDGDPRELDYRQVATADGCRSLWEWGPPGWMSIPILRKPWSGPCAERWNVLTCGKHWRDMRSPSTGWRRCPGFPETSDGWNIWTWPGSAGGSQPSTDHRRRRISGDV